MKQNEADLIMAKKNADLSKVNHEKIQSELLNEKTINANLKTQVSSILSSRLNTHENLNKLLFKKKSRSTNLNCKKD